MSRRTLVLGGARSGKSAHAEGLAPADPSVTYVATARRREDDTDWEARIAEHTRRRPECWKTVETADGPALPDLLTDARSDELLLVDDLATWLTDVLDTANAWDGGETGPVRAEVDRLTKALAGSAARVVLVSAEVGLGVHPATPSGRLFRDELGRLNARVAEVCDTVTLLVAGIPLRLR
ncbi:bifunctional adenosylcobinamide kinase/adenosylcobinamide-phosphate guanylyltransferase [Allokutzneria sp. A3M-2-11 16]|uniref:bifunctional adenosylcobinamide kinase/adenosylcobinamide-phosphate guanylyltransferase n=1 Tax=Allokutzneria sp. A3M-2-11 16 TaxID=2962043 RepID=UPI0020B7F7FA|nr:bifunctional adenosylcobinamide kinase/adenosylcobinamide-phosphate guanylyltransferase [Allokutzneria sp. A3M-2-11 16]MCP3801806.1 bifunctional adenosylcobinamide kinase/adenosylcobinamide-phosphate guanylyltransferase [Allokutzneria sp. A3M-2-11 16]